MKPMYKGVVNSPPTSLQSSISSMVTTISVIDASVLPDAPDLAMIGDDENTETILYTGKSGNVLTGVQRGFQGTAKAWPANTTVARNFAEYDWASVVSNILSLQSIVIAETIYASQWIATGDEYIVTIPDARIKSSMNMILCLDDVESVEAYSEMNIYRGITNTGSFSLFALNPPEANTGIAFYAEAREVN